MSHHQREAKVLSVFTILFGITLMASIYFLRKNSKFKCSDSQLHQVISEVEKCRKGYLICPSEKIDEIIKDVCR